MVLFAFLFLLSFSAVLSQHATALSAQMPAINEADIIEEEQDPQPTAPEMIKKATSKLQTPSPDKEPATKEPATDSKQDPQKKDIFLNFENSSLANVVNYMAELKNVNLLPDKALSDIKVSLTIREALTLDGAWNIFMTLLEVSGFSIVEVDGLHKVLPKDKKLTEALPNYINVPYTTLPDSDLTVRYVMFLQNLQVDAVKDLLASLLSDKHIIYPYAQANCFIITDRCYNIKSAMKVIQELETIGQPETVVVLRLKRTNAADVKGLIEGLMSKKQDANPLARFFNKSTDTSTEYFPSGTKIVAEERTNTLILMGSAQPIKKIEKFIVENIDIPLKAAESPLHIYELKYADAAQIAEILQTVTAPPDQGPGQQAARYGAIRGGVKYFKSMKFQIDKEGNRLIISCTDKQDWILLKSIIKDLDKPQPQVALETLFVSITASELNQIGGSIRNKNHGMIGPNIDFQAASLSGAVLSNPGDSNDPVSLLGNMLQQLVTTQGSMLLSFGRKSNIWAVFETIKTKSNGSVLAQPFLTIANKVTGKISVGSEQNVLMEDGGSNGKGYGLVSADTSLEVEPQINLDGVIRMKINVNISEFTNPVLGEKSTKNINTNVTMADGQVLVLGGFVQTKVGESTNKTPLLSNIPLLGWFFKNQSRTIDRTYIFIFMAPTIIKPRTTPGVELYSKMKLHQATNYIEEGIKTTKTNDPIFNWFFDPKAENYSHKVIDFANARYQPTSVDIQHDAYYRTNPEGAEYSQQLKKASQATTPTDDSPVIIPVVSSNQAAIGVPLAPKEATQKTNDNKQNMSALSQQELEIAAISKNSPLPENLVPEAPKSRPTLVDINTLAHTDPSQGNAQELVHKRLNISSEKQEPSIEGKPIQGLIPKFLDKEITKSALPQAEPVIVSQVIDPHPAQEDVLKLLGERMQKQRHISIDTDHLANQRKKLKSLIAESLKTHETPHSSHDDASGRSALKSVLDIPETKPTAERSLVVDPVKRNSLKDFLSQAEQPASTTRNKPA